jgi:pSer/pThr/pTyr-binding forkhead associated (FHA) protein
MAARGWLTLLAERVRGVVGDGDGGASSLPGESEHLTAGLKYVLVDRAAGRLYPLLTGLTTIGRLPGNDIVLDENTVLRRHCVLLVHAWGSCELHDTASRNGTSVNGRRVSQPVRLAPGDLIAVCQRHFQFLREEDCHNDPDGQDYPGTVAE